ncbi:MAG TPA: DUF1565 domain-containing protein, partial [Candidatus Eisenbacteria bacterium]|nr:DUF1565 domain-containing protein [Candidatus Eisenbacteria bacterium]
MNSHSHPWRGASLALAALIALGIGFGCGDDNPTKPKTPVTPGVPDAAGNYFVNAATGSDANAGTRAAPFLTIQKAIDVAFSGNTRADIYVAYGTYTQSLALRTRMSLHGGYDGSTWVRNLTTGETVVSGGATAIAGNDADSLTVNGFTIRSADATTPGGSSIGIHLVNGCQGVAISENRIYAGKGKAGSNGAPGAPGMSASGSVGNGADGGGMTSNGGGAGQECTYGSQGGHGGSGNLGNGNAGGVGSGPGAGGGGAGGTLIPPEWGHDGGDGQPGSVGADGAAGASFGTLNNGAYAPSSGAKGVDGGNGGGGGGGGGGAGTLLICGPG